MKKAISSALAAALIVLSPGLSCYEALAGQHGARSTRAGSKATNLTKIAVQQAAVWNMRPRASQITIKTVSRSLAAAGAPSHAATSRAASQAQAASSAQGIGAARAALASLNSRFSAEKISVSRSGVSGVLGWLGGAYDNFKARALSADPVQGGESSDEGGLSRHQSQDSNKDGAKDAAVPAPETDITDVVGIGEAVRISGNEKLKKAWANIKALPGSFRRHYIPGWTINAVGQEIQAVALPLFTAEVFGLATALMISGVGIVTRIPGAWMGSFFMNRFHPNRVNMAALIAVALGGASIAFMEPVKSNLLMTILAANSVIGGLAYGVTRGIAENILPKMIFGSLPKDASDEVKKAKQDQLEVGLNYAYQWVEIGAIAAALFVADNLLKLVGGSWMMAISSALTGLAAFFYAAIKFADKWQRPAASASSDKGAAQDRQADTLAWTAYLPLIYARANHFLVYGMVSTVLAKAIFMSDKVAGQTIGIYDGGSWLLSLLASLALLPKKMSEKSWTALMVASSAAFLWAPVLFHSPPLTMALGGVLGGVITIATNKWGAIFQQKLPESKLKNLSKWVMTWSILALLPAFAAVSAIRISPAVAAVVSMPTLLTAVASAMTAAGALMLWLTRGAVKTAPKK